MSSPRAQRLSWVLYDWANSGFGLIVVGPVFTPYFIGVLLPKLPGGGCGLQIGGLTLPGTSVVGLLTTLSMGLMALAAPVLGAVADIRGWTRRMLIAFTIAGSAATMTMALLGPGRWLLGGLLFLAANICFGSAFAFYNAFLPRLAPPDKQGSLSGWGFAMGYIGGALALILALLMIRHDAAWVPWALAMSGAWWLVFSLPAFIFLPEFAPQADAADTGPVLLAGLRRIGRTFTHIRRYRNLFLFLLAFLLYNDGIETVIAMSPAFGSEVLQMSQEQLIGMFLLVQFVAFIGAMFFGYLADVLGNKRVILLTLSIWVLASVLAFFVATPRQFTLLGVLIGIVLGGVQASSRAMMGQLAPPHMRNEAFGFFSISGKFASILGPLLFSFLAAAFSPRYGIFAVLPFLLVGGLVMLLVREPADTSTPPATLT